MYYTLCSFGQNDLQLGIVDDLVVKDVVNKPHLEHIMAARMVEVLVCGHVVTDIVACLPTPK